MNDHDDMIEREPEEPSSGWFWLLVTVALGILTPFLQYALIGAGLALGALLVYRFLP